jgi:hypothetical protein
MVSCSSSGGMATAGLALTAHLLLVTASSNNGAINQPPLQVCLARIAGLCSQILNIQAHKCLSIYVYVSSLESYRICERVDQSKYCCKRSGAEPELVCGRVSEVGGP